jgi:hypothetical protein
MANWALKVKPNSVTGSRGEAGCSAISFQPEERKRILLPWGGKREEEEGDAG